MAIRVLNSRGFQLHIDTTIKSEDDCLKDLDKNPGNLWKADMCWRLTESPGSPEQKPMNSGNYWPYPAALDKDTVDKMKDKYKMDLDFVYQLCWDCKHARGDGDREMDANNIPYDGKYPTCFFNLDVIKGEFYTSDGKYSNEPL
jgi:hypothetical protein